MLKGGILNPHVLSLIARVRHTNTLVIADRGFPFWPQLETVDISLVDDVPTVRQVLAALRDVFIWGAAFMAQEFNAENREATRRSYAELMAPVQIQFEPHVEFKKRVPQAVGLIRTGDTTQYGNIIVESA
jgi:D-ribose pyranase